MEMRGDFERRVSSVVGSMRSRKSLKIPEKQQEEIIAHCPAWVDSTASSQSVRGVMRLSSLLLGFSLSLWIVHPSVLPWPI